MCYAYGPFDGPATDRILGTSSSKSPRSATPSFSSLLEPLCSTGLFFADGMFAVLV